MTDETDIRGNSWVELMNTFLYIKNCIWKFLFFIQIPITPNRNSISIKKEIQCRDITFFCAKRSNWQRPTQTCFGEANHDIAGSTGLLVHDMLGSKHDVNIQQIQVNIWHNTSKRRVFRAWRSICNCSLHQMIMSDKTLNDKEGRAQSKSNRKCSLDMVTDL